MNEADKKEIRNAINSVVAAAVVSNSFRWLLFAEPQKALEQGYQGETFEGLDQGAKEVILNFDGQKLSGYGGLAEALKGYLESLD